MNEEQILEMLENREYKELKNRIRENVSRRLG